MIHYAKHNRNKTERTQGFIYVCSIFILIVGLGIYYMSSRYHLNPYESPNKSLIITKMNQQSNFLDKQEDYQILSDTLFSKISNFKPGVNASYEESDIKFMINELSEEWENNSWDKRNKLFFQMSELYEMWFNDKKKLWAKTENISMFKKNLEESELGLQKKEAKLNGKTK